MYKRRGTHRESTQHEDIQKQKNKKIYVSIDIIGNTYNTTHRQCIHKTRRYRDTNRKHTQYSYTQTLHILRIEKNIIFKDIGKHTDLDTAVDNEKYTKYTYT